MALWNDRDNRWIVNELKDGKNVNSWHWDEKNITKQFENKLKELIIQKEIIKNTDTHIKIIITKLNLFKGEINIVNRKGKKKLQYEFETELEGLFIDESVTETVKIKLPDIYDTEPEVIIDNKIKYCDFFCKKIQSLIGDFIVNYDIYDISNISYTDSNKPTTNNNVMLNFKIKLPKPYIYNLFTEQDLMSKYTDSICIFSKDIGKSFSFYNKQFTGVLTTIDSDKLEYEISIQDIKTNVTLLFKENGYDTTLEIKHTNISYKECKDYWVNKWIKPICIENNSNFIIV